MSNYFDDYYLEPEPQQPEQDNYIEPQPEQPDLEPAPAPKKERKPLRRWVSVVLAAALIAGSCGATALIMELRYQKEMKNLTRRMEDKITASQQQQTGNSAATTQKPAATGTELTPGQVYAQNVDAVVGISAEYSGVDAYGREGTGISSGTGFVITADGYVVTNYHVVEDGKNVTVTMHNGKEYEAKIVGYEANNDLALLKMEGENFPFVTIGKSADLQVGDQVVAIGNALSFKSSLTVGYVSGVDRVVDTEGVAMNMIQSDVAINSGNSGGPLFNMRGEVVGITTAKFSGKSATGVGIEGISFAIPMDDVIGMIEDLKSMGYVSGAYMGVMVMDVDTTAQYYGLPAGAFVESVTAGGAAEKGGIQAQDIITEVGGFAVTSVSDLTRVLRKFAAGETVSVQVYRSGQTKTLSVTLDEKPREEKQEQQEQKEQQPTMPGGDSFQEWYDFFNDQFGNFGFNP